MPRLVKTTIEIDKWKHQGRQQAARWLG